MAHKSHRQKALQSQLEPLPEISLVDTSSSAGPSKRSTKKKNVKPSPPPPVSQAEMDIDDDDDDNVLIDNALANLHQESLAEDTPMNDQPVASSSGFAPLSAKAQSSGLKNEFRRIPIPPHRMAPIKREWVNLYTPLVEQLGLQVRMNSKRRAVEMRVSVEKLLFYAQSDGC